MIFRKNKEKKGEAACAVQTGAQEMPFAAVRQYVPLEAAELRLYAQLRRAVPIIDAALDKIVRLVGKFDILCPDNAIEKKLKTFLETVQAGPAGCGVMTFLQTYLDQLLTFGNAVGEMVVQDGRLAALYNASLKDVELRTVTPLELEVRRRTVGGSEPVSFPELVLATARRPLPGSARGRSILEGLPFVSNILVQIYHTIGVNWARVGNVRFAVTCKPDAADRAFAQERAQQMAGEWSRAMRPGSTSDFVAVGDVEIKTIGADNQILDSEVPARQMLEQIVAKLGLPPFLLGLSWSSTERMSSQQADVLTSELEAYRRLLNPVIDKICRTWFRLNGLAPDFSIDWNDITLQDTTDLASAALNRARAAYTEEQTRLLREQRRALQAQREKEDADA